MHFMLQKEVVERMVAQPKTNDYGRLSVVLQYFYEMEYNSGAIDAIWINHS